MFRSLQQVAVFAAAMLSIVATAHAQPLRAPELPAPQQGQPNAEPGYLGLIFYPQGAGDGVRIKEVIPGSPAAQSGLQPEDTITAINGRPTSSVDDFGSVMQGMPPGAKLKFDVNHNGQTLAANVTLGNRPPPDQRRFQNFGRINEPSSGQTQPGSPMGTANRSGSQPQGSSAPRPMLLGVSTLPVDEQTRVRLGLPSTSGALVISRALHSPAEKANIPLNALIVALDNQRVGSPSDLSALLDQAGAGRNVEITYLYNGNTARTKVTLGPADSAATTGPRAMTPENVSPNTTRPAPRFGGPGQQSESQRVEAMEMRIRELEQKVQQLEDQLQRRT